MKKLNIIMIMLITSFVFMACEKEEADKNTSANNENTENNNDDKSVEERYEIEYYLDTSPDTINILEAKSIDGSYDFDQSQNGEIVDLGYLTWDLASLGEALVLELDDDHMVLELQNESGYVCEFEILEATPEKVELEIPVGDRTLHYTMTDNESELPIFGEGLEEGQIISFGQQGKACACAIISGTALVISAGASYCEQRIESQAENCFNQGKCADVGLCSAACYCEDCNTAACN